MTSTEGASGVLMLSQMLTFTESSRKGYMMQLTRDHDPDGRDILRQVQDLLNEIESCAPVHEPLHRRLRRHMIECLGPEWAICTLIAHTLPTGEQVYTASRMCIVCGKVHTFVLCRDREGFVLAAPSPVQKDERKP
jgi:hypothetical protein